jgi:ParB-like chromosome segregation protein Spo0J
VSVQEALNIERVPWDALKPHPRNARNGDIEAIVESVRVNGVYRPIICAQDGTILAGHHLWFALGELKHDKVDVVTLPVHPDSPEAVRIMLADNRTADLGVYDDGLLLTLLTSLNESAGLIGTGYDDDDLIELVNRITSDGPIGVIEDPPVHLTGPQCPQCGYQFPGRLKEM